jgi:hypothetical protein
VVVIVEHLYYYYAMTLCKPDLLPEDMEWHDDGCEFFPSCLNCPLPRCLEEEPRGKQKLRMVTRAGRMSKLRDEGKTTAEIARLFGVSIRTVQRAISAGDKKRGGND